MLVILWLACAPVTRWQVDSFGAPLDEVAVAPVDEDEVRTVRRRVYARAPEGSARALHNAAVRAEQDGRLVDALDLAREAYVARPTSAGIAYVQELAQAVAVSRDASADEQ